MADITMPQLGETVTEGTITRWFKQVGEPIAEDEVLFEVSTDKVDSEVPSPAAGVVTEILVQEGETVDVGTVLGFVGEAGESASAGEAPKAEDKDKEKPAEKAAPKPESSEAAASQMEAKGAASSNGAKAPEPSSRGGAGSTAAGRFVSPLVRRIASEQGLSMQELESIPGSGNNGRVTKNDLLGYIESRGNGESAPQPAPSSSSSSSSPSAPAPAAARAQVPKPSISIPPGERELVQPASSMRKVIMQNMVASKQTSAHVTTFFEIDFTAIDKVRKQHKDRFRAEEGLGLTYTTFIAAAAAQVLKRHPYVNAEIRGTDLVFKRDVHLGIAVAIEQPEPGLMVPVLKHADQMNLRGLAHGIADLANRVRTRKIKPDELSGGTFTITNPGNYGAIIGTPIINQPQVAILGVGGITKQAVVLELDGGDVIAIRNRGWLSLSFDHRLIDGATADLFMADLKKTLEEWTTEP